MEYQEPWQFRNLDQERVQLLSRARPFATFANDLCTSIQCVNYRRRRGDRDAKGWWRPVFEMQVGRSTFDFFFNSKYGYRGQYYEDPIRGDEANMQLLGALVDLLMESTGETSARNELIRQSVLSCHAKIWINEDEHSPRQPELIVEIAVPEWKAAGEAARRSLDASNPIPDKEVDRIFGVRAPEGTRIEVKGAWLDCDNRARRTASKMNRAQDIHDFGVS